MEKVSLSEKFAGFSEQWKPKIVGELNGQQVKLVKFQGPFVWHHHDNEDELFLVVKGRFRMEFRDRQVMLEEGEFLIVPRGVEHRPVADEEAHILLFEPASTVNTGNVQNERTVARLVVQHVAQQQTERRLALIETAFQESSHRIRTPLFSSNVRRPRAQQVPSGFDRRTLWANSSIDLGVFGAPDRNRRRI